MTNVNIFDSATPQGGDFFRFKNVGDSVQGTYIDKRNGIDGFGNNQTIYVLQDSEGKIWNLGFRDNAMIIHERMNTINLGQIVGFRYDEERESKRTPGAKVKIIRIYADPKLVDHAWVENRMSLEKNYTPQPVTERRADSEDAFGSQEEEDVPFSAPADAVPIVANLPATEAKQVPEKNEALDAIRTLAKTKGLTKDSMSIEEMDEAIETFSGLTLEEENLTKIIIALTGYTAK